MSILILTLRTVTSDNQTNLLVALITDKPNTVKKASSDYDNEALKTKLNVLTMVPKKKYPFAVTSAQEVGWDNDEVRIYYSHIL